MAKIQSNSTFKNLQKYDGKSDSQITDYVKANQKELNYTDSEIKELKDSLLFDSRIDEAFEEQEKKQKVKNNTVKVRKEIEAETILGSLAASFGNFFEGLGAETEMGKYFMTKEGKYLKRKDYNLDKSLTYNKTIGIDEDTGEYDRNIWEETTEKEVSDMVYNQANKRVKSNSFYAGAVLGSFFDNASKTIFRDAPTGLAKLTNNNLETNKLQGQSLLTSIGVKASELEMEALKSIGMQNTTAYKLAENYVKEGNKSIANYTNEMKTHMKERAKEIKASGNSVVQQGVDALLHTESADRFFNQQQQLRSMIKETAKEIDGFDGGEFFNESKASNINSSTIKYNGADVPLEFSETGSKWDAKQLIRNDKGEPILDNEGKPVYKDKYSLADKFIQADYGSLLTKHGFENLSDAVASSAGFLVGGAATSNFLANTGKGIGKVGGLVGKVGNISDKGAKMFSNVTSKLDELMPITSKVGGTGAVVNKAANSFNKAVQTTLNSYVMTNSESQGIGRETANNIYNSKIDKVAGIDSDVIRQKITEENPDASENEISLILESELQKSRKAYADNNPDEVADITALALASAETAASINNLNIIFNMNFGAAFAKGKSFSRDLLKNPISAKNIISGGYNAIGEGVQEYFEEGLFNSYSQKATEGFANDKDITLLDYFDNDFLTKENVTSGLIGMLSGVGQSAVMSGIGTFDKINKYKEQQESANELKDLAKSNPEQLKKILHIALDSKSLNDFQMQQNALGAEIEELRKNGQNIEAKSKSKELSDLTKNLFISKSVKAAKTGTSGVFNDVLEELKNNEEFSEEERQSFGEAQQLNNNIADTFDKYIYFHNNAAITLNRVNAYLLNNEIEKYKLDFGSKVSSDYDDSLRVMAMSKVLSSGVRPTDENYESSMEEVMKTVNLNPEESVQARNKLVYEDNLNSALTIKNDLDTEFNYIISRKGQKEIANKKKQVLIDSITESATLQNQTEVLNSLNKEEVKIEEESAKKIEEQVLKNDVAVQNVLPKPKLNPSTGFSIKNATILNPDGTVTQASNVIPANKNDESEVVTEVPLIEPVVTPTSQDLQSSSFDVEDAIRLMNSAGELPSSEDLEDLGDGILFNPVRYNPEDDTHNKIVDSLSAAFSKDLAKNPNITLEGVIARFSHDKGMYKVIQAFDLIVESFDKATGRATDSLGRRNLYDSYFGVDTASNVFDSIGTTPIIPGNTQTTPTAVTQSSPSPESLNETASVTEEGIEVNKLEKIEVNLSESSVQQELAPNLDGGLLNAESSPKLAFLGLEYSVSEDGQEYKTTSTKLNETAKIFLDPRNFKVGQKYDIGFNFNYLMRGDNTLRIWKRDPKDGLFKGIKVSVEDRIRMIFPEMSYQEFIRKLQEDPRSLLENEEFLKMIPVGIVVDGEMEDGGLNDYDWWNTRNVAATVDIETKKLVDYNENILILKGKQNNLEVRRSLLNSENFTSNVVITQNTSSFYNKLLLETKEEEEAGYNFKFQSLLEAFGHDMDYFDKNVSVAFFSNGELINHSKNKVSGLVIGGKKISNSQITNLVALKKSIQSTADVKNNSKSINPESGRRVMISKSGVDKNGNTTYTAHLVTTNHNSLQEKFKNYHSLIDKIVATNVIESESSLPSYGWVYKNRNNLEALKKYPSITPLYISNAEKLYNIFKKDFGIDITKKESGLDNFQNHYPKKISKNSFSQDIDLSLGTGKNGLIPDVTTLFEDGSDVSNALMKILDGQLKAIKPSHLVAKNTHTQYIYSPFEKNGETLYSEVSQKKISYSLTDKQTSATTDKVMQTKLEEAKKALSFFEKGLAERPDDTSLQNSIDVQKELVKNLEDKVDKEVEEVKVELKKEESKVKEFTDSDINSINHEVFYRALSKIDVDNFSRNSIIDSAYKEFNSIITELRSKGLDAEADFMLLRREEILGLGYYDGSVKELIDVIFDLEVSNEFEETPEGNPALLSESVKDYSKESFEQDIRASLGMKVKAILSGIVDTRFEENTFADFKPTLPLNEALDFLQQALAEAENNTLEALAKVILDKKNKNEKDFGFYEEIFNRLNNPKLIESGVVNEILYNMYQTKLNMRFLMYSFNKEGQFTAQNYDANSKAPEIVKRNKWKENFKNSSLITRYEEGYFKINDEEFNKVEKLLNDIKASRESGVVDTLLLDEYFRMFGIELNSMTLPVLLTGQLLEVSEVLSLENSGFINRDTGLVNILFKNLKNAKTQQESGKRLTFSNEYVTSDNDVRLDIVYSNNSSNLNLLVAVDNDLSAISMTSIYVGGKIVNSFTKPNLITNTLKKIKNNPLVSFGETEEQKEFITVLENTPTTQDSLILEMLKNSPRFKEYFDISNISLEALKEQGAAARTDRAITDLSDRDEFITLFNLFTHIDGQVLNDDYGNDFGPNKLAFRRGTIAFPTLSDSSQKPLLKTALLDVNIDSFEDSNIDKLDESILSFLTRHLVLPNLKRIEQYVQSGQLVNIEGHNAGAGFFTDMPSLNFTPLTIRVKDGILQEDEEVAPITLPAIEVFKVYLNNGKTSVEFLEDFKTEIHNEVHRNIDEEVDQYISKDGESGLLISEDIYTSEGMKFVDKAYINSEKRNTGNPLTQARLLMYDYVINYMVSQKEIQSLFAGDLSNYFKDGHSKNFKENRSSFEISKKDIVNFYYSSMSDRSRIETLISAKELDMLAEEYPQMKGDISLFPTVSVEERLRLNMEINGKKFNSIMESVQNNLSKRLKALLSPGSQLPNSFGSQKYYQVLLEDVDTASEVLIPLILSKYPNLVFNEEAVKELTETVEQFKMLDDILPDLRSKEQVAEHKILYSKLAEKFPKIKAFLKNSGTDAQEYTTWKENLDQLLNQGRLTKEKYDLFNEKLTSQSLNGVNDSNRLTKEEMKDLVMQPTKPLHAGLYYEENNGYNYQRFVYVKSSSFPLIPQMTEMFPKLNIFRKNLESLQTSDRNVRASYGTANKIGATRNSVPMSAMYSEDFKNQFQETVMTNSVLELDRSNFYIQQDKPFKSDKNAKAGKLDYNNRATQFEKIILGDGISDIKEQIFPSRFSEDILEALNITPTDNKISGSELQKIYNELYKREQKLLKDKLFRELGISNTKEMRDGNPKSMERLASLLGKRLNNKQDRKALELQYYGKNEVGEIAIGSKSDLISRGHNNIFRAEFKMPLYMTPNSKKFESVLNAVINKSMINLKLPGFSSPVASQEGFDIKGYADGTEYSGLITTESFDPKVGLKATLDSNTGQLVHAQVFVASKYKVKNEKTGEYDYIDLKDYLKEGTNTIDFEKLPQELLQLFSFRIPTSAHQSGIMVEVVGFLPHTVGDMMIVPKDHATQIGEDFDIDVRYMYNSHYVKTADGKLKMLEEGDFVSPKTVSEVKEEFTKFKNDLFNEFFRTRLEVNNDGSSKNTSYLNNDYWNSNREILIEIAMIENALESSNSPEDIKSSFSLIDATFGVSFSENLTNSEEVIDEEQILKDRIEELKTSLIPPNIVSTRAKQLKEEYKEVNKDLYQAFKRESTEARRLANDFRIAKEKETHSLRVIENNIVSIYKSVYSTTDRRVRNLVSEVLSTDFSEDSANEIDKVVSSDKKRSVYNIYSPSTQRKIFKLGADGKMGIGVHSNAVTLNSILQQHNKEKYGSLDFYTLDQENNMLPINIPLGNLVFDGKLGLISKNGRRISASVMESQNSSTDNQKLQIMGRRNENKHTINVLAVLQATGNDFDINRVDTVENDSKHISYASLFISQPIIRDYVALMEKYNSDTSTFKGNTAEQIKNELFETWGKNTNNNNWHFKDGVNTKTLKVEKAKNSGSDITSQKLYDTLLYSEALTTEENRINQWYVLESFLKLKGIATHYNRLQKFINVENGGMGVSYFDTINLMKELIVIAKGEEIHITNSSTLIGDYRTVGTNRSYVEYTEDGKILKVHKVVNDALGNLKDIDGNSFVPNNNMRLEVLPSNIEDRQKEIKELEALGYIKVQLNGEEEIHMIRPNNHYAHKIVNSVVTGYEMWNSIFPYDDTQIRNITDDIINSSKKMSSSEVQDLRYSIVSSLKDYIYSNSLQLFENNVDQFRSSLFYDTDTNQSLASYLLNLSKHDSFKNKLFKQNFFKDLVFDTNKDTFPSTIRYNTSDVSKGYSLSIYNVFEKLRDSKVELPDYNGKPYTYELLMKDILRYSLIADQGNGAIGFRHLLPMSLFDKYGVTESVKLQSDPKNETVQNVVFNGVEKAVVNFFGSNSTQSNSVVENLKSIPFKKISAFVKIVNAKYKDKYGISNAITIENGKGDVRINIKPTRNVHSTFVKQFFQHNSKYATSLGSIFKNDFGYTATKKLKGILADNNLKTTFNVDTLKSLYISNEYEIFDDFVSIADNKGKSVLLERVNEDGLYVVIPKLGVFGLNEYSVGNNIEKSSVSKNNSSKTKNGVVDNKAKIEYITNNSVATIVQNLIDGNGDYSNIFSLVNQYVDLKGQKIVLSEDNIGEMYFNTKTGVININKQWLENSKITLQEFEQKLLEEVIHKLTTSTIDKYISVTGIDALGKVVIEELTDSTPVEVLDIIESYQEAVDYIISKYGIETFKNFLGGTDKHIISGENPEANLELYRASNLHEFLAGMFLKDDVLRNELDNIQSKINVSSSILGQFVNVFKNLLSSISKILNNENSIAKVSTINLLNFLTNNVEVVDNTEEVKFEDTPVFSDAQQFLNDNVPAPNISDGFSSEDLVNFYNMQEVGNEIELPIGDSSLYENLVSENTIESKTPEIKPSFETATMSRNDVRDVILSYMENPFDGSLVPDTYSANTIKIPGYKAWFGLITKADGSKSIVTNVFSPSKEDAAKASQGNVFEIAVGLEATQEKPLGVVVKETVDNIVSQSKNQGNIDKLVNGVDNLSNFENINKC